MARTFHCYVCDIEMPEPGTCARCRAEMASPLRLPMHPTPGTRWEIASPRFGVHIAGPVVDGAQFCSACGDLLACSRGDMDGIPWPGQRHLPIPPPGRVPMTTYTEGFLIERGRGWQAIKLRGEATCVAVQGEPAPVGAFGTLLA